MFSDILSKYLIYPKYSKEDIEKLGFKYISELVKEIWNNSVKDCFNSESNKDVAITVLQQTIKNTFCNIDENIKVLINTNLNISPVLNHIEYF